MMYRTKRAEVQEMRALVLF